MTTAETIFVSMTAGFAVVHFALYSIQTVLIDRYKKVIKDCHYLATTKDSNKDEILKYCLMQILKQSIEKEDYETAERCKVLLSNLAQLDTVSK